MLGNIINKKNVNHLCCVPKHHELNVKSLRVITRHGVKIRNVVNPSMKITKNTKKKYYPNPHKQRELVNDATRIFQKLAQEEDTNEAKSIYSSKDKTLNEFIKLLTKQEVVT